MATEIPVAVEEVRGRVSVRLPGGFKGVGLLLDGAPAPAGEARLTYTLPRVDGGVAHARLNAEALGMKFTLVVDGRSYPVGVELPGWLIVFVGMPLLLLFIGGALGGLCGGIGAAVNQGLVQRDWPVAWKALACLGVAAVSGGAWLALVTAFHLVVGR